GRNVRGREQHAARKMEVRNGFLISGEVPTDDEGLDARAVDRPVRREDGIDGHHLYGVFKISPQKGVSGPVGRQNTAGAAAGEEELGIGGLAGSGTSPKEDPEFPRATPVGKRNGCFDLDAALIDEVQSEVINRHEGTSRIVRSPPTVS